MSETDPRRWTALPVILVASFMGLFDVFVVNVAAPDVQHDLHASSSELQLVLAGYAFAYAAFLVTGGRLGDRYSYRRLFIGGMALFTIASAACGLAGTPAELIGSRVVQGLGAAMMVPQVLALITALFPAARAPPGARVVRRRDRPRRGRGPGRRRRARPGRPLRLGLADGVLRQRPDRDRHDRARAPAAPEQPLVGASAARPGRASPA